MFNGDRIEFIREYRYEKWSFIFNKK
jgi:hypothetical protein